MNILSFKILPSVDTNDHEVRIIVDDYDLLGDDYLGIDPPELFGRHFDKPGKLIIGRCTCGYEGCSCYSIDVTIEKDTINWKRDDGLKLEFDKLEYLKSIALLKNDFSWENNNRRVERILNDFFLNLEISEGFLFNWASTRIKENTITLSFIKDTRQKLFEISWDGHSTQNALKGAEYFKSQNL